MGDLPTAEQNPGEMDCRSGKRGKVENGLEGGGRRETADMIKINRFI